MPESFLNRRSSVNRRSEEWTDVLEAALGGAIEFWAQCVAHSAWIAGRNSQGKFVRQAPGILPRQALGRLFSR